MPNTFSIDFINKKIVYVPSKGTYTAKNLYSFLQDVFDEPENMKYDIPIIAKSKTEFALINGWKIDPKSLKRLNGGVITTNT